MRGDGMEQMEDGREGKKSQNALAETAQKVFSGIAAVFICVILGVFPLYYHDYYFDILTAKYKFYWIAALVWIGVCLAAGLVFAFIDRMEYGGKHTRVFLDQFRLKNLKKQPPVYWALFFFWLFCAISTLQSDYLYESFWGNEGRFNGLFLLTLYSVGTFLIARFAEVKRWHLDLFLVVSLLVCLFGITDYFQMNLLGWKTNVDPSQRAIFTSTIGNVNTYTAYVGVMLGVSSSLFLKETGVVRASCYYLLSVIGFIAIITGQSDNAYLALAALFLVLPFFAYQKTKEIARYVMLAASLFTVIKLVEILSRRMADRVIGFSGMIEVLGASSLIFPVIAFLWGLAVGFYCWGRKQTESGKTGLLLRKIWIGMLLAMSVAICLILADANLFGHADRYASISGYVVFNDNWGTNRGFGWRAAWEAYLKQPFLHKLFGYGPDTFGILTWDYRAEALERFSIYFESAHNEYLQYLVTIGPFALAAYLVFLGDAARQMAKRVSQKPCILACLMGMLCYNAQAVVNINLPIATPIMWLLLGMGMALCRESASKEKS